MNSLPPLTVISSPQNAVFRDLQAALESKGPNIIVHGLKLISEILDFESAGAKVQTLTPITLVARESFELQNSQLGKAVFAHRFAEKVTRVKLSDSLFDQVDPFGIPDVMALIKKPELETWSPEMESTASSEITSKPTLILATQNPTNLGACLRSAAAFGVENIVTLKECSSPFHPKVIRSSMGATFRLRHFRGPSIQSLTENSETSFATRPLITLDLKGTDLATYRFAKNPLFLIGEEGAGVPLSLKGPNVHRLTIPMSQEDGLKKVESLNAAVSCGIALYAWFSGNTATR